MMEEFGLITTVDFSLMDRVFYDGFWLETQTADGSNFWQPISTHHLTSPSFIFPASDNVGSWNTYPGPDNILKQTQTSDLFLNNSQMDHHLSHSSESNVPSGSLNNPDIEMNTRFWVGANRNTIDARAPISVRTRLDEAIFHLRDSVKDKNVLIQIWFPVKIDGKQVLITNNQPFSLDVNCKNLKEYRDVSKNYQFAADEESKEFVGLPSRVFLKKLPEWTPDVRFFKREEYPRVIYAQQYNVSGSLALPVFELGSRCCLGVVEIVTTTQKLNYRPELENICRALQAVDLKSFDVPSPPSIEGCEESYQSALADIRNIVKYMCSVHELPLAQTWAPCIQQNKQGCRHSDENYAHCVSTIDLACYVADPHVSGFHEACSEHHLLKGEGIPGKAFMSNKPCFSEDVTSFSKTDYPLSHHARVFKLCAAVAIRLRSTYTGKADFVLEFFLPPKCKDSNYQKMILDSLMSVLQQTCQSLRVPSHQELTQETSYKETVNTTAGRPCEEKWPNYIASRSEEASQNGPSWIMNITNSQHKGKGVSVSFDDNNEESGGEFRVTTRWDNPEEFSISGDCHSLDGKTNEKKRTKAEKTISLQVLRQYFAGSLKDAAKNIGVCPTTLKRICRQHGITRWPSRKIKKVDHSLKKLQLVMDSVQGAEGRIKLGSFYSNFPEFVSPNLPVNTSNMNIQTASKSPSSSSNHSTSSSYCLSTGVKQSSLTFTGDALSAEQLIDQGMLKRERSDVELLHQEAPPMPQKSSGQAKDDTSLYRIKANFGEEKIRFSLHPRWSFNDLKDEVFRRFNVENNVGKVDIKYLDDDAEWVLLTCDADLDECVDIHRSSKTRTIKIRVINKAYNQSLGSSFGSNK